LVFIFIYAYPPAYASGGISGATFLDNGFYGSDGVNTPSEPKNPVYIERSENRA